MAQVMNIEERVASSITRTGGERVRRRVAEIFMTCAMGAWIVLAVVPVLVILFKLS